MTFITGQLGNEKGRSPGIIDRRAKFRQLFEPHAEKLVVKVIELALAGDINALKFV